MGRDTIGPPRVRFVSAQRGPRMIKGFKDFLLRGNVVDLAIAVVVGAAFGNVVGTFTSKILQPLINSFGGARTHGLGFRIVGDNPSTFVDVGALITAAINFVIVAAVVYFLVLVPVTELLARRRRGQ